MIWDSEIEIKDIPQNKGQLRATEFDRRTLHDYGK